MILLIMIMIMIMIMRFVYARCFFKCNFRQLTEVNCRAMLVITGHLPSSLSFYVEKTPIYKLSVSSLASYKMDRLACAINRARGTCWVRIASIMCTLSCYFKVGGSLDGPSRR